MRMPIYPAFHPSPRKTTDKIGDTDELVRTMLLVGEDNQRHRWQYSTSLPTQLKLFLIKKFPKFYIFAGNGEGGRSSNWLFLSVT
jgi:hypothetical protein